MAVSEAELPAIVPCKAELRMERGGFGCFGSGASGNNAMRSGVSHGARRV
ncbi:MAG: hypothetical protein K1X86_12890 [Ignavibacteria bacterium]|nr:hypothetical protein [Ignavibacteria bacterium]